MLPFALPILHGGQKFQRSWPTGRALYQSNHLHLPLQGSVHLNFRNFVPNVETIEVDIVVIANAEYDLLQKPLFLEMSLLTVQTPSGELTFEAGPFTAEQETELIDKHVGSSCTNRIVLAHHDGSTVRLFEGELKGVLCEPRGQVSPGLGWDRIFQPQGYQRTISEMSSFSFSVNVRNKPYLELGFFLRSHVYEGLFEVHITGLSLWFHLQLCLRTMSPRVTSSLSVIKSTASH